jgi:MFS family permease
MSTTASGSTTSRETRASWLPMVGLFLAQVLMSFNVAALPVSIGGIVDELNVSPTTASTTIVVYGLFVAALVMLGAKVGQRIGWALLFRIVVVVFAVSSLLMLFGPSIGWLIGAQCLAGASAAFIVPSLVAIIAENYRGRQQATAIGSLGSARAISGVSAFFVGGALGTLVGWRPVFGILVAIAAAVFCFSFTFRRDRGDASVRIDGLGALLIGLAIVCLTLGVNNLGSWGLLLAEPDAPFSVAGVSPAPLLIVVGVVLGQAFFVWTRCRERAGRVPLVSLSVLRRPSERAAVYCMFLVVALEGALNFTVPLYIQIVQGRTPFDSAVAMMPFNLTVFVTALLVVRFYARFSSRRIGVAGFVLTTAGLSWLALVVTNNWETLPTILGLFVFGVGQGALVTLVFNVLVTAAPKRLAGDVGSIRGTTQNLASAVGTAVAGALLVTVLSVSVGRAVAENEYIPMSLADEVSLESADFVSNDQLRSTLAGTDATPAQTAEFIAVNTEARLTALRVGLLSLAGLSAVAILPASRLPRYRAGELPDPEVTR